MKKINTINYGGKLISAGLVVGLVLPLIIRLLFHVFLWQFCIAGGIIIVIFTVIFSVEMHQDFGKVPYYKKHLKDEIPFDPETQTAVIMTSVCTGEMTAGFKNRTTGHFTEVMPVENDTDIEYFCRIYGIENIKKVY